MLSLVNCSGNANQISNWKTQSATLANLGSTQDHEDPQNCEWHQAIFSWLNSLCSLSTCCIVTQHRNWSLIGFIRIRGVPLQLFNFRYDTDIAAESTIDTDLHLIAYQQESYMLLQRIVLCFIPNTNSTPNLRIYCTWINKREITLIESKIKSYSLECKITNQTSVHAEWFFKNFQYMLGTESVMDFLYPCNPSIWSAYLHEYRGRAGTDPSCLRTTGGVNPELVASKL